MKPGVILCLCTAGKDRSRKLADHLQQAFGDDIAVIARGISRHHSRDRLFSPHDVIGVRLVFAVTAVQEAYFRGFIRAMESPLYLSLVNQGFPEDEAARMADLEGAIKIVNLQFPDNWQEPIIFRTLASRAFRIAYNLFKEKEDGESND